MILARLHRGQAGVYGRGGGMSGSPVYIDGRLVGALSYRIGQFSKEPIAGDYADRVDAAGAGWEWGLVAGNAAGWRRKNKCGVLPLRQAQGQNDNGFSQVGDSVSQPGNRVSPSANSFSEAGDSFSRHGQPEIRAMETPLVFGDSAQRRWSGLGIGFGRWG